MLSFLIEKNKNIFKNNSPYSNETIKEYLKVFRDKYKNPITELLIEWYKMKFNPTFEFDDALLDDLGFKKCFFCYSQNDIRGDGININNIKKTGLFKWWDGLSNDWQTILKDNYKLNYNKIFYKLNLQNLGLIKNFKTLNIELNSENDISLKPIYDLNSIKYLRILEGPFYVEDWRDLDFIKALPFLEVVSIENAFNSTLNLKNLQECNNIKGIKIIWSEINDTPDWMVRLNKLKYLNLWKTNFSQSAGKEIVESILAKKSLKRL